MDLRNQHSEVSLSQSILGLLHVVCCRISGRGSRRSATASWPLLHYGAHFYHRWITSRSDVPLIEPTQP